MKETELEAIISRAENFMPDPEAGRPSELIIRTLCLDVFELADAIRRMQNEKERLWMSLLDNFKERRP